MTDTDPIIGYTTAPVDYDSFGTVTLDADAGTDDRDQTLRKVSIQPEHYEWQTNRYASGLHCFSTEAEARKFSTIYQLRAP